MSFLPDGQNKLKEVRKLKKMTWLERRHLEKFCDKWGIDYQEIDSSLTYNEAKKHLQEIKRMLSRSLDVFELQRMEEQQTEYIEEHPLMYYRSHMVFGETKSSEVGEPDKTPQRFSLSELKPMGFSLRTYFSC
jgi:hypothetical protein